MIPGVLTIIDLHVDADQIIQRFMTPVISLFRPGHIELTHTFFVGHICFTFATGRPLLGGLFTFWYKWRMLYKLTYCPITEKHLSKPN